MNLDETQRKQVKHWIEEGLKLSDIQKRLETEWGLRQTYLEVRLLVDDLKLMPKDPPPLPPSPKPDYPEPEDEMETSRVPEIVEAEVEIPAGAAAPPEGLQEEENSGAVVAEIHETVVEEQKPATVEAAPV